MRHINSINDVSYVETSGSFFVYLNSCFSAFDEKLFEDVGTLLPGYQGAKKR